MVKFVLVFSFFIFLAACAAPAEVEITRIPTDSITPISTLSNVIDPTRTMTMVFTPTKTITASPIATITTVESTPEASITSEYSRPASHLIASVTGERQAYALSCESRAAVDWAAYYGFHILESDFQFNLPFSENPDTGFVGRVTGPWGQVPPYDYGVHAAPVAELLREYGIPAIAVKGFDLESLKDIIAQDHPVLTWVIGNVVGGVPYVYTDPQGNQVTVAAYEHVVNVIGYNDETDTITYMNNGRYYETPASVFDNSWSVLEYMAIYHENGIKP